MVLPHVGVAAYRPHPRLVVGLAALTVLTLTVLDLRGGHSLDLEVYRQGAAGLLAGTDDLYAPAGRLPFTYPPFAAGLFVVVELLPSWALAPVMALASLGALYVVLRRAVPALAQDVLWVAPALVAAVLLEPVAATLSFGQVNLILVMLVMLDLAGPRSTRWGGVLVGVAAGIKLTPAIFLVVLACRRDWAGLARATATMGATVAAGFMVLPRSSTTYWTSTITNAERVGDLAYQANQSLTGSVWRLTGGGNTALTATLSLIVVVVLVTTLLRMGRAADRLTAVVLAALAGLLISPISWSHHWVWLVPVIGWLIRPLLGTGRPTRGAPLLSSASSWWLAMAWAAACYAPTLWWTRSGDHHNVAVNLAVVLTTNSYVILGLVTFGAITARVWSPRRLPELASTDGARVSLGGRLPRPGPRATTGPIAS